MAKKQPQSQRELFGRMSSVVVDPNATFDQGILAQHIDHASTMLRHAALEPNTVFDELNRCPVNSQAYEKWKLCGVDVMVTPRRLQSFGENPACVCCGRVGNVFLVEQHINEVGRTQYINFYCSEADDLILMTVDHILPDSMGGKYHPDNFQTMCQDCNGKKSNLMSPEEINAVRDNIGKYAKSWVNPDFLNLLLDLQAMISKSKKGSLERAKIVAVFDQYRRQIKHATSKQHAIKVIAELREAVYNINPRKTIWSNLGRQVKHRKRMLIHLISRRLRRVGDLLIAYSKQLNKAV